MKNAAILSSTLLAAAFAQSPAAGPALAPDRLARLDRLLNQYVEQNRIAGAVALVLRDGKPVYERAVGWSDKEAGRRMAPNTIFRIASQTKALYQHRRPRARRGRQDWSQRARWKFHPQL